MQSGIELAEETQRYIEANLKPLLTVKEVTAAMDIGAPDLDRLFGREKGITIKRYIETSVRMRY